MGQPLFPSLYLINTRVILQELGQGLGRAATFDDVPDKMLDEVVARGFDWVWFLGVWQTGTMARDVSRSNPAWRKEYREQLPNLKDEDITGSPFAISAYTPHADLGGRDALLRLRDRVRGRGLRLMLDFVPNHTAPDHVWRFARPEFYIQGTAKALARDPQSFWQLNTKNGPTVFARGRDPYFPAWADVLQLNYRHAGLRAAMIDTLNQIAELCDGVRCDMAMLLHPEVFARTWGQASWPVDGSAPVDGPFWSEATAQVKRGHPGFVFMAEVYWDLEWELQQQGFDYTYDKRLYDRLKAQQAEAARKHLWADPEYQRKSARFLENHDEERAARVFSWPVHQAAAIITFLVPGLRFFHEGQFDGRRVRPSMHLGRRPAEKPNPAVRQFYEKLLPVLTRPEVRDGRWQLRDCRPAWGDNSTWNQFVAFTWEGESNQRLLVAVNYGPAQGQCYVHLPPELHGQKHCLRDLLSTVHYDRDGDDLASRGLYVDLPAWGYHVFEMTPASP